MTRRRSLLGVVYRKELLDSLRDRRALISAIVVPLVVIPLLLLGMGGLTMKLTERAREDVHDVMVLGEEHAPDLVEALEELETIRLVEETENFAELIAAKELQAAVRVPEDLEQRIERGETAEITIYTYTGEGRSSAAAGRVEQVLQALEREIVRERLAARGLEESVLEPFQLDRRNVAPPEKVTGALLGGLLPYILIVLCLTGAIYPAIDLTAGEKERGTMETLLSSPVPRRTLVLGKFLVVLTFSVVTALLAVSALGGTVWLAISQLNATGQIQELSLNLLSVVGFFILLLPMAALFSALLLALSLFARTFREAQTYVSPLMIAAILPAGVALMPGVELTPPLALVPVLNISLIGRDLLSGIYEWGYISLILLSSTLYAGCALWVAVKLFEKESVIFRE